MKKPSGPFMLAFGAAPCLMICLVLTQTGERAGGALGQAWGQGAQTRASAKAAETITASWPQMARLAAEVMIERYGEPNSVSMSSLIWRNNGPWQRTVVHREGWSDRAGVRHPDVLEQVVSYQVPLGLQGDLAEFDNRLSINSARSELSFISESEKMNFLAINLADEIVNRRATVEQARDYAAEAARLMEAGKTSAYMEGFLFKVENKIESDEP